MSNPSKPSSQKLYAGLDTFSLDLKNFDDLFPSLKGYFPSLKWCGFYLGRTEKKFNFTREAEGLTKLQKSQGNSPYIAGPRIWVVNYAMKDPKWPPNASTPPVRPQRPTDNLDWIGPAPDEAHSAADMYQWNPGQEYRWTDYTGDKKRTFDLFPVDLNTSTDPDPGLPSS